MSTNEDNENNDQTNSEVLAEKIETKDPFLGLSVLDEIQPKTRTLWQRYLGPIRAGSLRGGSFAMCSITFGAGCLLFPSAVRITGPILAAVLFISLALLAYYTEYLLVKAAVKLNVLDYEKLIKFKLGNGMAVFYDINNIVFVIGVIMLYQKAIYEFGLSLLEVFFGIDQERKDAKLYLMLACFILVQIPLGILKNISKLQYASIVAVVCIGYCIVVVMVEMPFYFKNYLDAGKTIPLINEFHWKDNNYFDAIATFLFGYSCHNGILQVLSEISKPNERRSMKIIRNAFIMELVLYGLMAFCGYFSTFADTPDIFITRPDLPGFKDYFIVVAQATLFICLHCVVAVNYNIMRASFKSICFAEKEVSNWVDFIILVSCLGFCNVFVFYLESVIDIIGIVAGFSNILICFINPVLIYVKTFYEKWSWRQLVPYSVMVFLTVTGTICTIKSIITCIENMMK